jgi:hypothetical protein
MMLGDRLDQLRRIPLPAVLRESGAQRDRTDRAKWHTPKGDISITGMKFMNWHQSLGGGGAIDLAMHLNDLDFRRAVAWLQRCFSISPDSALLPPPCRLTLPPPDHSRLSSVKHYLVHERAIAPSLTDFLIASGKLYAIIVAMRSSSCLEKKIHLWAPNCAAPVRNVGAAWRPASKKISATSPSRPRTRPG